MAKPLPDVLDTGCCQVTGLRPTRARHLTSCRVALDFHQGYSDGSAAKYSRTENPPTEPDPTASDAYKAGWLHSYTMETGTSYEAITWMYPWAIRSSIRVEIDLDVARFLDERLDDYLEYVQEDQGYEWWEKPLNYLFDMVAEDYEGHMQFGGGGPASRDLTDSRSGSDFQLSRNLTSRTPGETAEWTEQATIELHQALGLNREGTAREAQSPPDPTLFDPTTGGPQ